MRSALVALLLAMAAPAAAQPATEDLGGGWRAMPLDGALSSSRGIACSDTHAYLRHHMGRVGRFDGATVEMLPEIDPTHGVFGVGIDVSPAGTVAVVGGGNFARFDGTRWSRFELPVRHSGDGVLMLDGGRAIVPADGAVVGISGETATRFDAGTWRALAAVDGIASDLWVVGQGGVAMHWSGGAWTATNVGRDVWLHGVQRVAANDVWAWGPGIHSGRGHGEGGAFHWDGATWTERLDAGHAVRGLVADASTALAIEENVIHRWNGTGWDEVLRAERRSLAGACRTRDRAYVLDEQGAVLFRTWP